MSRVLGGENISPWFKQPGVYGESERARMRPRLRVATVLEHRRLSEQGFTYFIPFLPLAVCPDMPDVLSEYCQAYGRDVEVVHWKIDRPLVPSLIRRGIDTAMVFGVRAPDGPELINFANGIILQDEATRLIFRLYTTLHRLIEPGVSMARPSEKILADRFNVYALNVESPESVWYLKESPVPVDFLVAKAERKEKELWQLGSRFWKRGVRTKIIV